MANIIRKIRQYLCAHDWRVTKYQALVPGTGYQCSKCGKQHRAY